MKNSHFYLLVLTSAFSMSVASETILDKMVYKYLEKSIPIEIYSQSDIEWELGTYSVRIVKNGQSAVSSSASTFNARVPVNVGLQARIKRNIGIALIDVNCNAAFNTRGVVTLLPIQKHRYEQADARIEVKIPDVLMDCEGFKVPITQALNRLVTTNKAAWEQKIQTSYRDFWRRY